MLPALKGKIRRVGDAAWEIPVDFKPGMRVPARVFATEQLLNEMDDGVFDQVTNVACLPGIQRHAYCMPDGHWGYGFPIGGVAAFDLDEGIISPGGIGFDINCLPAGTKVLTSYGYTLPIEEFESAVHDVTIAHGEYLLKGCAHSVLSLDREQKRIAHQKIALFMKREHAAPLYEVRTRLGYAVRATPEHPLLTEEGMVRADALQEGQRIAIHPFIGVPYEIPDDTVLVGEEGFTTQQREELRKRGLLPLALSNPKLPIMARLFGYLLGDGSIHITGGKGFVCAYGKEEDLAEMAEDFKELGFSARLYSRERDHSIRTRYGIVEFRSRNHELHVSSVSLAKLFFALGYPQGDKTITPYGVPAWILDSPLWVKRLFLSGLFGAELSKPRTHTRTGFDCPTLSMNKNSSLLEDGRRFCIQLLSLLEEFGIRTHKLLEREDYRNRHGPTHRLRLQMSSDEENLLRLWPVIGFAYNRKRERLATIAIFYIKEKERLTQMRGKIAQKAKELKKKGLKLREVQELLSCPEANRRFIARHFYEQAGQRIPLDMPSFKDFVKEKEAELTESCCLFDTIERIGTAPYDGWVYDFSVPQTHTFIADNVIVSNCGMRLLMTDLTLAEVQPKLKELVDALFTQVPCGVGRDGFVRITQGELRDLLAEGAKWCLSHGYAWEEDLERIEDGGCIPGADPDTVSHDAMKRGIGQIGTLGSGNHYLEVQHIPEGGLFDPETGKKMGISSEGQIGVMLHCGSRGFGHQVATDYLRVFDESLGKFGISVKDRQLACAPFRSDEGQRYYAAMACAANMAFVNRQVIMHRVREVFSKMFKKSAEELGMHLVYDVAHNIAKIEEHQLDGKRKKVLVHRKGSTRSFGPGHEALQERYRSTGQPVIIGGSMETGSYLLAGTKKAEEESFGSTAHGSGRTMSRTAAKKSFRGEALQRDMANRGIYVRAASMEGLAEEAGKAYKSISEVVRALELAGLSRKVAVFRPIGNIKG